jgi:hypothetical protein
MGEAKRRRLIAANTVNTGGEVAAEAPFGSWPLANNEALEQVQRTLSRHGIDFSRPGFHDSPAFISAERTDGTFIDNVARLVEAKQYSIDELHTAAAKIEIAAECVRAAVEADGRPGLCVTASSVLSRMLDALGIWNYCAKSTLTITFPIGVSKSKRYFYSIDVGEFTAPHSIVVAPPFTVIDVTVKHQSYDVRRMVEALPNLIASRSFTPYTWSPQDIVAPSLRQSGLRSRAEVETYLRIRNPQMLKLMGQLPGRQVSFDDNGLLQYVLVGVGGYTERLEELRNNSRINGRLPLEIFNEDVMPRLRAALLVF